MNKNNKTKKKDKNSGSLEKVAIGFFSGKKIFSKF